MECRVVPLWRAALDAAANEKHGLYSRFHHGGPVASMAEAALNATAAEVLVSRT